jgi:hypothetical protein
METSSLSNEVKFRITRLFPPEQQEKVRQLLHDECGNNLPFQKNVDASGLDRVRFAALKLGDGNMESLEKAIALAKKDWRDLLMAAKFGSDIHAHETWLPAKHW